MNPRLAVAWSTLCVSVAVGSGIAIAAGHVDHHAVVSADARSSRALLRELHVGSTYHAGYERSKFKLWDDIGNGCTVRDRVLYRDAIRKPAVESGCRLVDGAWRSPYDGVRTRDPEQVQVDHVVPLAQAWGAGAWKWSARRREQYANDLGTSYDLLAVSAHSNESKGDQDPSQWLPPRRSFDCTYEADYTAVLWRWQLHISQALHRFLARHLKTCGWPRVATPPRPTTTSPSPPVSPTTSAPVTSTTSASASPSASSSSSAMSPTAPPSSTSTTAATHPCTRTSSGSCIKGGEFCPAADYGQTGYDAEGRAWVCEGDSSHPHWE